MPQYDFRCKKCKKEFSLYLTLSEKERKKPSCPSCKGRAVEQMITPFMTKTSRKG